MFCINTTSMLSKPIYLTNELLANRVYVGTEDVPSFPNRLVFTATSEQVEPLISQLRGIEDAWVREELEALHGRNVVLVVPFALRVEEEVYTNFRLRRERRVVGAVELNLSSPTIFMRGIRMHSICTGCAKQATLKGRLCPDYVEGSFACFKTSHFNLNSLEAFGINDKGELVFNVAPESDAPGERVATDAGTSSIGAEEQPTADN